MTLCAQEREDKSGSLCWKDAEEGTLEWKRTESHCRDGSVKEDVMGNGGVKGVHFMLAKTQGREDARSQDAQPISLSKRPHRIKSLPGTMTSL